MSNRLRLVALALAAAGLAACETTTLFQGNPEESTVADSDFVETEKPIAGVELDTLWERAQHVVGQRGYTVDSSRTRYEDREIVTHWNTTLSTSRFEGTRTRVRVHFRQTTPGAWIVGVAVQRQRNADIDKPSEPTQAQWEDTPCDASRANELLYRIESGFMGDAGGGVEVRQLTVGS